MLVQVSEPLHQAVFSAARIEEPSILSDIEGVPKPTININLANIAPSWLKTMILEGDVLLLENSDYTELPYEITEHLKVLRR